MSISWEAKLKIFHCRRKKTRNRLFSQKKPLHRNVRVTIMHPGRGIVSSMRSFPAGEDGVPRPLPPAYGCPKEPCEREAVGIICAAQTLNVYVLVRSMCRVCRLLGSKGVVLLPRRISQDTTGNKENTEAVMGLERSNLLGICERGCVRFSTVNLFRLNLV